MNPTVERYSLPARALHWLVALLIVSALVLALVIPEGAPGATGPSPEEVAAVNLHRTVGFLVLVFLVLRVIWRFVRRPPDLPARFGAREKFVTHAGHAVLYLLMAAVPLLGWAFSGARGLDPITLAGISIPDLIAHQPRPVAHQLHEIHELAAWTLIGVAAAHAAMAVLHHVKGKDGFLRRMS